MSIVLTLAAVLLLLLAGTVLIVRRKLAGAGDTIRVAQAEYRRQGGRPALLAAPP